MLNLKLSQGFSLIEVLIALSILATGLLGITALQNEALRYTHAAFVDSQAQFLISDIIERIRANSDSNSYTLSFSDSASLSSINCAEQACTPKQMTTWDIKQWRQNVEDNIYLPGGESQIRFNQSTRTFDISIRYNWSSLGQKELYDEQRTISIQTRVE